MNNDEHNIRATGEYAVYRGTEYLAYTVDTRIRLLSDAKPLPAGFTVSKRSWVRGEALVPLTELDRLVEVRSTCLWRGHPFEIGVIIGDVANVKYIGKDLGTVSNLSGMNRWEPYEVVGEVPVAELTQIKETAEEVDLRSLLGSEARNLENIQKWQRTRDRS